MKTLKKILQEVKRSPERAETLVRNISKRQNTPEIKFKDFNGPKSLNFDNEYSKWEYYRKVLNTEPERKLIPINNIVVGQSGVGPETVIHNIKHKQNENPDPEIDPDYPITVIKKNGVYHLADGHHRYFAKKVQGETHIDAHVYNDE